MAFVPDTVFLSKNGLRILILTTRRQFMQIQNEKCLVLSRFVSREFFAKGLNIEIIASA
jgi:hypothetical protein